MSAALAVETNLEGLEGVKLLSPARSPSGIAFELTEQFKTSPSADVQSKARARLEGYLSTPVKECRPRSPAEDPLPRLLSRGRAAKLHIENEAKKQTAERAGTKQAERLRRLSDGLNEKASLALEKRKEVLAENSQKAKKHNEAVEDKLKKAQEAEEHRREELKAKLEPSHALEKRKEVLAEISQKAKKHAEAVEDKLRKFQEAEEHRREELKAKLDRKTGSKVSGKVSDGLESIDGPPAVKFEPPARAAPRRLSEPELQPGSFITGAAEGGAWQRLACAVLAATEVA
jgi:hypothetical protein